MKKSNPYIVEKPPVSFCERLVKTLSINPYRSEPAKTGQAKKNLTHTHRA